MYAETYARANDNRTDTERQPNDGYILALWYRSGPEWPYWRLWFRRPEDRRRFQDVFSAVGYQDFQ